MVITALNWRPIQRIMFYWVMLKIWETHVAIWNLCNGSKYQHSCTRHSQVEAYIIFMQRNGKYSPCHSLHKRAYTKFHVIKSWNVPIGTIKLLFSNFYTLFSFSPSLVSFSHVTWWKKVELKGAEAWRIKRSYSPLAGSEFIHYLDSWTLLIKKTKEKSSLTKREENRNFNTFHNRLEVISAFKIC